MLADGKNELQAMKSNLVTETRKELAEIVVAAAERVFKESDTKLHEKLVAQAVSALKE